MQGLDHTVASEPSLRLIIAGGGTGGHVFPAVAVLEELRARQVPLDVLWVGSKDGRERETAQELNIPYRVISTGKLRRYLSAENIRDLARIPAGIFQARRIVREFRPDVVFATGGFVSVPTVVGTGRVAPILTHEQTAILGLATRINLRFADVLALSFEETARALNGNRKVRVTGNPIRQSLLSGNATATRARFGLAEDLPIVLVMGGARGASPVNRRLEALLPDLLGHCQVIHQTGPDAANGDASRLRQLRSTWPEAIQRRYQVVEFIGDELKDVYAATSLVVARAGAGTVAELAAVGLPSVLIPLPGAGGDEQTKNARTLEAAGAAVMLPQAEATPDRLRQEILALLDHPERLRAMADAARKRGRPDAAKRLTDLLLEMAEPSRSNRAAER